MAKNTAPSTESQFNQIMADLKAKKYSPIYFLMGEEPYYIDQIADYIAQNVLEEDEKSFNQEVFYGKDVEDVTAVINSAKQYPMMAERRVVIVKEAQNLNEKQFDKLELYAQNPQDATMLVFCYKGKKLDMRKKYASEMAKIGVVFNSESVRDYQVPSFIKNYMRAEGREIDDRSVEMLAACLGNNLGLIVSELTKLQIVSKGERITPEIIEKNIGISRSYNVFALTDALATKNALMAYRVVKYAEQNPKEMALQPILANLFSFYVNLLHYHYIRKKSELEILGELHIQSFILKKYQTAAQYYNGISTLKIIGLIREYDAKGKGFGTTNNLSQGLLKELVGKILIS